MPPSPSTLRRSASTRRRRHARSLEEILVEDTPIIVPYFYNYISGYSNNFTGVRVSALGQMFLDQASTV